MIRSRGRNRLGFMLAMALGVVAIFALPAVASAKDRNHDRIPDRWEKSHHLSLSINQAHRDQDRDHLRNLAEFKAGDNPRNDDSDGDGVIDGEENAGTIQSFDAASGKLVIDLFGSDTISGLVTDQTKVKCEDEHSTDTAGSSSGDGEVEPGDDSGGHGEEPGDDSGGDNSGTGSSNSGSGSNSHDDNGVGANCTSADLLPGAVVQQAEIELEHGSATFEEIELAHTPG